MLRPVALALLILADVLQVVVDADAFEQDLRLQCHRALVGDVVAIAQLQRALAVGLVPVVPLANQPQLDAVGHRPTELGPRLHDVAVVVVGLGGQAAVVHVVDVLGLDVELEPAPRQHRVPFEHRDLRQPGLVAVVDVARVAAAVLGVGVVVQRRVGKAVGVQEVGVDLIGVARVVLLVGGGQADGVGVVGQEGVFARNARVALIVGGHASAALPADAGLDPVFIEIDELIGQVQRGQLAARAHKTVGQQHVGLAAGAKDRVPVAADVEVLATIVDSSGKNHPVAVMQKNILATAFHPELTADNRVHKFFVENLCRQRVN